MKLIFTGLAAISILIINDLNAQELSASEVLNKAIRFHDPNGVWQTFKGDFTVEMTTPKRPVRTSKISLDFGQQLFDLQVERGEVNYRYWLSKNTCILSFDGDSEFSEEIKKEHRLTCERANMMKNYYTYLYGLPMKLKDPGTHLHPQVQKKRFKGKEYLVLKVDYAQEVGEDTWYFYFDPQTFAMEVYQFYHEEAKNDGEYIILSGLENVQGIRMPKKRDWYYNKDDKFLGSDLLLKK